MMPDRLLSIEIEGWRSLTNGGAAAHFRGILADNAVVLLADLPLSRDEALSHWAQAPRWKDFRLSATKVLPLTSGVAAITYLVTATESRTSDLYRARCTSVYTFKGNAWRLAFHEQLVIAPPPVNGMRPDRFRSG
jgi:hypothetical protein